MLQWITTHNDGPVCWKAQQTIGVKLTVREVGGFSDGYHYDWQGNDPSTLQQAYGMDFKTLESAQQRAELWYRNSVLPIRKAIAEVAIHQFKLEQLNKALEEYHKIVWDFEDRSSIWARILINPEDGEFYAVTAPGLVLGDPFNYAESTLIGRSFSEAHEWIDKMKKSFKETQND